MSLVSLVLKSIFENENINRSIFSGKMNSFKDKSFSLFAGNVLKKVMLTTPFGRRRLEVN